MKVKELKHIIETQLKDMPSFAEWEVVIPISGEKGIGATATIKTNDAHFGFDHNHGKFFITPEKSLYLKK